MEYIEISLDDMMNFTLKNDIEEWVHLYEMGISVDVIERILVYTDKQFGSNYYDQFCDRIALKE